MNEAYIECLVKAKSSAVGKFGKYVLVMLMLVCGLLAFGAQNPILFLVAVALGGAAYWVNMQTDVEYEYLYLDKELTVDKVLAKTKRKRVAVYQLDRMEIVAPIKSYHLDDYKNRQVKVKDYSIGYEEQPDLRYVIYYEGGEKLILSPSPEMIKMMRNVAPRKVYNE